MVDFKINLKASNTQIMLYLVEIEFFCNRSLVKFVFFFLRLLRRKKLNYKVEKMLFNQFPFYLGKVDRRKGFNQIKLIKLTV
jgi:hypothetical protein